ncbi:MAG: alpha/beta fold hydrolase [Bacteroidota bacterium]
MSLLLALIILAALFLISAALVVLVVGPLILLQPERRTKEWYRGKTDLLEPRDAGLPQEDVSITGHDGVLLKGWLVAQKRGKKTKGTILYLHGVGDCKTAGVAHARLFYKHGYNVLLYDSRAHGESGGTFCTYGYYEKHDVSSAIAFLQSKKGLKVGHIGVFGTSMGAAIAIQAAATENRIKTVVAEACFTDLRTISVDYQRRIVKLPWHFLRNVAMGRSQKIAGFRALDVSPVLAVRTLAIPLLFVHGTADRLINYEYSKTLYHYANEPKEILLVPGGNHTDVWEIAGDKYENTILSFFAKNLR